MCALLFGHSLIQERFCLRSDRALELIEGVDQLLGHGLRVALADLVLAVSAGLAPRFLV